MSYRTLPYFERGLVVSASEAKQDRIKLEIGDWVFMGDDADLSLLLFDLANAIYPLGSSGPERQRLFNTRQGPSYNCKLAFRRQAQLAPGGPLFGGLLRCMRTRSDEYGQSIYRLFFQMALNPSRSLNHQRLHPEIRSGASVTSYPENELRRRSPAIRTADEIVLDGGDNVVLARIIHEGLADVVQAVEMT